MSVRPVERAVLLIPNPDRGLPRALDVEVLTSGDSAVFLTSPVPLATKRVWLKRMGPNFDRKFLECHVNNPGPSGIYYSLRVIGFATWDLLTDQILQHLLRGRVATRPSTARPEVCRRDVSRREVREQSLMPLLSAIGLVVVYACRLPW